MKKVLAILMAVAMTLSLAACGKKAETSQPSAPSESTTPAKPAETPSAETSFPKDTITMIIPQGLGGGSDLIARTIASEMEKVLGVSVICKNVEGGSTSIGLQELADSKADGYTIAMTMTNLSTLSTLGYSELTRDDFTSLGAVNFDAACIMIRTDEDRFTDLNSLVEYSKAHPGELNWGTGAAGGMWHLAILNIFNAAGISGNVVPNSGGGTSVGLALANGDIDVAVFSPVDCMAQIDANQIVPIASMTEERMEALPDVPTAKESGYDVVTMSTRGYLAPKGTPADVVAILEDAIKQAVESDTYQNFIASQQSNVFYLNGADYYDFMTGEVDTYVPLLQQAGLAKK